MPESRFHRWFRLPRQLPNRPVVRDINALTKWLMFLQSFLQQVTAYHCLYTAIKEISHERGQASGSENIFHILLCSAIIVSLTGDLVAVTSSKMAVADSRHWPVGIYFFILAFLDQLIKASNIFFSSNRLQKECMDRVLGPRVGGSIPVDHFIHGFCDLRREVTQIWSLLGFFVEFLMCAMYSGTAHSYASHRISLLQQRQQQQQPQPQPQPQHTENQNIPLYTVPQDTAPPYTRH